MKPLVLAAAVLFGSGIVLPKQYTTQTVIEIQLVEHPPFQMQAHIILPTQWHMCHATTCNAAIIKYGNHSMIWNWRGDLIQDNFTPQEYRTIIAFIITDEMDRTARTSR